MGNVLSKLPTLYSLQTHFPQILVKKPTQIFNTFKNLKKNSIIYT